MISFSEDYISLEEHTVLLFYPCARAVYGIEDMCSHQWNWASNNPWGYRDPELVKDSS
jgi:hypothetical protein